MNTLKNKQFTERSDSLQAVQREIERIKGLHSLLAVMKWANLSFKQFGERLAECEDRRTKSGMPRAFSKAQVHNWTRKKTHKRYCKFPREHRNALASFITLELRERVGVPLIVSFTMNSPLKTRVWIRCTKCNARIGLDLRRVNPMVCEVCQCSSN